MPGIHSQRFDLDISNFEYDSVDSKTVIIRAAFPQLGAGLVFYETNENTSISNSNFQDQSCINIYSKSSTGLSETFPQKNVKICLSNLQIFHCTPGSDIWGGNCAIRIHGENITLLLESCSLQSDSGRGVGMFLRYMYSLLS